MYTVRKAEKQDCGLIHDLAGQVWEPTYGNILSKEQVDYMFDRMYSVPSLENQMDNGHTYYILYHDEKPAGYLSIERERKDLFHLQKIYILPDQQRNGGGKLLIEKAEQHVTEHAETPVCTIELNVNRNNKAVGFYKKRGFVIDREGDFDIGNGFYMNDYVMKKTVRIRRDFRF
ncbi:MAG: GNAT family N-acetyltransferase [Candidatus Azobacteroides sp.]|nr:GNAT family N-acetyltransferase [Candidatus Azobacteroides sp.]